MGTLLDFFLGREEPTELHHYHQTAYVDPSTLQVMGNGLQGALSLPTFFRGVQILTDVSGQLPWRAQRGGIHSDAMQISEPEIVDPQPVLLVKPSPFHTRADCIRLTVQALILRGNAFFWLSGHDASGFPTIAVPVNPDEVSVTFKYVDGRTRFEKQYMWRDQVMREGYDLLHISLLPLLGQPAGLGPLDAAASALGYAVDAEKFGGEFFAGSATPAGVLQHPGRLDKEEADLLRSQWETQHQGGRGTAVLSGGIEYAPISITPEQAQFIATRAFNNQQIATLLGIPQHLLNAGQPQGTASSLTYANLGMVMEELYRMTLSPVYLARIEESFQRLLPRGQSVRFETTELLRTDDASRWAAQKIALDAGILTNDEVRALEGRAPIPEDELPDPEPVMVDEDEEPFEEVAEDDREAPVPGGAAG
jgi:HK97 family phage portal protein